MVPADDSEAAAIIYYLGNSQTHTKLPNYLAVPTAESNINQKPDSEFNNRANRENLKKNILFLFINTQSDMLDL